MNRIIIFKSTNTSSSEYLDPQFDPIQKPARFHIIPVL